jgi:hypothetical protein
VIKIKNNNRAKEVNFLLPPSIGNCLRTLGITLPIPESALSSNGYASS